MRFKWPRKPYDMHLATIPNADVEVDIEILNRGLFLQFEFVLANRKWGRYIWLS